MVVIDRSAIQLLFDALHRRGYKTVGPVLRDGAIVYDELATAEDLPAGWTDRQEKGLYRIEKREDQAVFGYAVGPHSWKKFLHPPAATLWRAENTDGGIRIVPTEEEPVRHAFIGVRACEIQALSVLDGVFLKGAVANPGYRSRREKSLIVAVNCGQAGGTCFCVSMDAGPRVRSGFDLALTEVLDGGEHYFTVEAGSDTGAEILREIPHAEAAPRQSAAAEAVVEKTASQMGRSMDTAGIKELLYANTDHPQWDRVASRCLTCANCTMVCPTCFCTTEEHVTDLDGSVSEQRSRWDSCFTLDFSYVHGGVVRSSTRSRYRQWMNHKLATWIDQFGTSGCVGCGRCITWCPVGIDITEEVRAIRENQP
jgi:sulfhydrogenase subunit beta (sulfur reductase)